MIFRPVVFLTRCPLCDAGVTDIRHSLIEDDSNGLYVRIVPTGQPPTLGPCGHVAWPTAPPEYADEGS